MNLRKERQITLMKKYKINIENGSNIKILDNFSKIIKKYEIDEQLVQNLKESNYKRPTAV